MLIKRKKQLVFQVPDTVNYSPLHNELIICRRIIIDDINNNSWIKSRKETFTKMLKEGHIGVVAEDKQTKEIVAYGWIAFNGVKPDHIPKMPADVAWLHFERVKNTWQGKGIQKQIILECIRIVREELNINDIFIDTTEANVASRRNQNRLGFSEIGIYKLISIGTKRIPMLYFQFSSWDKNAKHPPMQ